MATVIDLNNITNEDVQGAGTFDVLMRSVKAHLEEEYTQGRIVGAEYANTYMGVLNATLQQAIQFEMTSAQAGFSTDITEEQAKQAVITTSIATATQDEQIAIVENDKLLSDEKVVQAGVQGNILDQQELQAIQQTALVTTDAEVSVGTKTDRIDLAAAQTDLVQEQVNTQVNQTDNVLANTEVTRERGGFR